MQTVLDFMPAPAPATQRHRQPAERRYWSERADKQHRHRFVFSAGTWVTGAQLCQWLRQGGRLHRYRRALWWTEAETPLHQAAHCPSTEPGAYYRLHSHWVDKRTAREMEPILRDLELTFARDFAGYRYIRHR